MSPYNSGKVWVTHWQEAPIVPLKMGYLRWPPLVISAVAPLDVSHGLEWAVGTGPWGGGNRSRSQHGPSGPGARNSNPPGYRAKKVQVCAGQAH